MEKWVLGNIYCPQTCLSHEKRKWWELCLPSAYQKERANVLGFYIWNLIRTNPDLGWNLGEYEPGKLLRKDSYSYQIPEKRKSTASHRVRWRACSHCASNYTKLWYCRNQPNRVAPTLPNLNQTDSIRNTLKDYIHGHHSQVYYVNDIPAVDLEITIQQDWDAITSQKLEALICSKPEWCRFAW